MSNRNNLVLNTLHICVMEGQREELTLNEMNSELNSRFIHSEKKVLKYVSIQIHFKLHRKMSFSLN